MRVVVVKRWSWAGRIAALGAAAFVAVICWPFSTPFSAPRRRP